MARDDRLQRRVGTAGGLQGRVDARHRIVRAADDGGLGTRIAAKEVEAGVLLLQGWDQAGPEEGRLPGAASPVQEQHPSGAVADDCRALLDFRVALCEEE